MSPSPSRDEHRPRAIELPVWLTRDCERVQGEYLEMAAALQTAALSEFPEIVPSLLKGLREMRRHFHDHVTSVQAPNGLFDYLASNAASLTWDVDQLCQEHREMDRCAEQLERQLEKFDPTAAEAIRQKAWNLAQLTCCHQQSGCRLAHAAG